MIKQPVHDISELVVRGGRLSLRKQTGYGEVFTVSGRLSLLLKGERCDCEYCQGHDKETELKVFERVEAFSAEQAVDLVLAWLLPKNCSLYYSEWDIDYVHSVGTIGEDVLARRAGHPMLFEMEDSHENRRG